MEAQRQSVVLAAAVLGGSLIVATVLLMLGAWLAMNRWVGRIESAIRDTSTVVAQSSTGLGNTMARSIDAASQTAARPYVQITAPEPIKIRGVADDGAVPINARMAK